MKKSQNIKTEMENELNDKEYASKANTDNQDAATNLNKSQQCIKKHFKNSRSLGYSQNIQLSSNNSNTDLK